MALSDLEAARDAIDARIATVAARSVESYGIEGVSVKRQTLASLIEDRKAIDALIKNDGENLFQEESFLVP